MKSENRVLLEVIISDSNDNFTELQFILRFIPSRYIAIMSMNPSVICGTFDMKLRASIRWSGSDMSTKFTALSMSPQKNASRSRSFGMFLVSIY